MAQPGQRIRIAHNATHLLAAVVALLLLYGLIINMALIKSPAYRESVNVTRGWLALRGEELLPAAQPPLSGYLSAAGVLLETDQPDASSVYAAAVGDPEQAARDLLWEQGFYIDRAILFARMPTLFMAMLLGALIYRWTLEIYNPRPATYATALYALAPAILGYAWLADGSFIAAAFILAATYAWLRLLKRYTVRWLLMTSFLFALALTSSYAALYLLPMMVLSGLWYLWRRVNKGSRLRYTAKVGGALVAVCVSAAVAIWIFYGFQLEPHPFAGYVEGLQAALSLEHIGPQVYTSGSFYDSSVWFYSPLTLLLQMPLSTLLLLVGALALVLGSSVYKPEMEFLFPAAVFIVLGALFPVDTGLRAMLPVMPLLLMFCARIVADSINFRVLRGIMATLLIMLTLVLVIFRFPNYQSFLSVIFGGPANSLQWLAGSDIDQGSDLKALAQFMQDNQIGEVYLSDSGLADPAAYGINAVELPSVRDHDGGEAPFYPLNPEPGIYVISATNLIGIGLPDYDTFGFFLTREATARLGESLYVYDIRPAMQAEQVQEAPLLGRCTDGAAPESNASLKALTGVDNLLIVPFDCGESLFFPDRAVWLLLPADIAPVIDIGPADFVGRNDDGSVRYKVWIPMSAPAVPEATVQDPAVPLPLPVAGHLELLGYELSPEVVNAGETLTLTAWWRLNEAPPPPVSIFAHLLDENGALISAADDLGLQAEVWEAGMILVQQHHFEIPPETFTGSYKLSTGLYDLNSGVRFPVYQSGDEVIDRIVLRQVEIGAVEVE